MARAALQLGVRDVATMAAVSPNTIARLERGEALYARTVSAIQGALEAAGVEFIDENGGGAGVRLRKAAADAAMPAAGSDAELAATGQHRGRKRPKGQSGLGNPEDLGPRLTDE
jgi:transcriptional regulator with XRE-family HTH domain